MAWVDGCRFGHDFGFDICCSAHSNTPKKSLLKIAMVYVHDGRQFYVFTAFNGSTWGESNGYDAQDLDQICQIIYTRRFCRQRLGQLADIENSGRVATFRHLLYRG